MKSPQTLLIEKLLLTGLHTMGAIARQFGISPNRVSQINKKMTKQPRAEVRELWNVDQVLEAQRERVAARWVVI